MWWRRLAEVETEHQNREERGFKWLWTWNGCWCQTGWISCSIHKCITFEIKCVAKVSCSPKPPDISMFPCLLLKVWAKGTHSVMFFNWMPCSMGWKQHLSAPLKLVMVCSWHLNVLGMCVLMSQLWQQYIWADSVGVVSFASFNETVKTSVCWDWVCVNSKCSSQVNVSAGPSHGLQWRIHDHKYKCCAQHPPH